MTDDFLVGATWGAMRAQLSEHYGEHSPGDFSLDVLDAALDAVEKLPSEHRDEVVNAALDAWAEASERFDERSKPKS